MPTCCPVGEGGHLDAAGRASADGRSASGRRRPVRAAAVRVPAGGNQRSIAVAADGPTQLQSVVAPAPQADADAHAPSTCAVTGLAAAPARAADRALREAP